MQAVRKIYAFWRAEEERWEKRLFVHRSESHAWRTADEPEVWRKWEWKAEVVQDWTRSASKAADDLSEFW